MMGETGQPEAGIDTAGFAVRLRAVTKVYDSGVRIRKEGDVEDRRKYLIDYRMGDVSAPYIPRVEPLKEVARHFIDCVTEGKTPITDGKSGLRVVRILEAAQRSIKAQGGRITL